MFENLTKDELNLFLTYLESDISYYEDGLKSLEDIKTAINNVDLERLLEKHGCNPHWTMDDVDIRYKNTSHILEVIKKVINNIKNM